MSLSPSVVLGIVEVAKTLVQAGFTLLSQAGKTNEEIDQIVKDQKAEFDRSRPAVLPDRPPSPPDSQ